MSQTWREHTEQVKGSVHSLFLSFPPSLSFTPGFLTISSVVKENYIIASYLLIMIKGELNVHREGRQEPSCSSNTACVNTNIRVSRSSSMQLHCTNPQRDGDKAGEEGHRGEKDRNILFIAIHLVFFFFVCFFLQRSVSLMLLASVKL